MGGVDPIITQDVLPHVDPCTSLPTENAANSAGALQLTAHEHLRPLGALGRRADGAVATHYNELLPGVQSLIDPEFHFESQVLYGLMLAHLHAERELLRRKNELPVQLHLRDKDARAEGVFPAYSIFSVEFDEGRSTPSIASSTKCTR